mmetsp:Transcript_25628/g.65129  ORF Transcript_25628/g.65129 Transcript_25628/m.65129 type:complete len:227 (+) Transcript_25628:347-1027(+)
MPASSALISSTRVTRRPSISSMDFEESATDCSSSFFLSSDWSNWVPQYSFLLSSPTCSVFKLATISSIMVITFSKPADLPRSARRMRSRAGLFMCLLAVRTNAKARALCETPLTCTCTKLELAPGKVFLKRSRASSSLRTLIVSARATNSSLRVILIASHSEVLVPQLDFNSSWNFWSAESAFFVSSMSLAISEVSTPRRPMCSISLSSCTCRVPTSFFLAAMSAS